MNGRTSPTPFGTPRAVETAEALYKRLFSRAAETIRAYGARPAGALGRF